MRPPTELLAELTQRSIILTVATDRLQVAAPSGALTAELRAEIAAQKPALLAILAPPPAAQPPAEAIDPADFAPLRDYLDRYGTLTIDPRDPPWADPRPDLADDHSRWHLLLQAAYQLDAADPHGLYGALAGMRCCGARLEIIAATGRGNGAQPASWRLVKGDELSDEEYQHYRQTYLVPHKAALTRLLSAPGAAQVAHQRPTPPAQPALTGRTSAPATSAPPSRKNASSPPAAQPALLEVERTPEPAPMAGGEEW